MNKPEETFYTTKGDEMEGSFRNSVLHTSAIHDESFSQISTSHYKENGVKYKSKGKKRKPDKRKESFISDQTAQTAQTAPMVNEYGEIILRTEGIKNGGNKKRRGKLGKD